MKKETNNAMKSNINRSNARLSAVQSVYLMGVSDIGADEIIRSFTAGILGGMAIQDNDDGSETIVPLPKPDIALLSEIVHAVASNQQQIQQVIAANLSEKWPVERLEPLLKAILKCSIAELAFIKTSPKAVVISEYIDIAKSFYQDAEPKMVNAVLDKIATGRGAGI